MSVQQYPYTPLPISAKTLEAYRDIPSAVASDCLARGQTMQAGIKPLDRTMRICAQARTAECPVGDNSAIRAAIGLAKAGEVIVVNAQGYESTAVFGGLMTLYAKERGVTGLVIDGAVRDSDEIIDAGLAMFARAICPRGPRNYPAGCVDGTISVGGVSIRSGDLIIGDADGVTVVPYAQIDTCLEASLQVLEKEEAILKTLKTGGSLAGIYGTVDITPIEGE